MKTESGVARRLLKDTEVAQVLGLCRRSIQNLVADGVLSSLSIGRARRFDLKDVETFIESRKIRAKGWKEQPKGRKAQAING